jgi:hypothetical protein
MVVTYMFIHRRAVPSVVEKQASSLVLDELHIQRERHFLAH